MMICFLSIFLFFAQFSQNSLPFSPQLFLPTRWSDFAANDMVTQTNFSRRLLIPNVTCGSQCVLQVQYVSYNQDEVYREFALNFSIYYFCRSIPRITPMPSFTTALVCLSSLSLLFRLFSQFLPFSLSLSLSLRVRFSLSSQTSKSSSLKATSPLFTPVPSAPPTPPSPPPSSPSILAPTMSHAVPLQNGRAALWNSANWA